MNKQMCPWLHRYTMEKMDRKKKTRRERVISGGGIR